MADEPTRKTSTSDMGVRAAKDLIRANNTGNSRAKHARLTY
jgi:hypothetical protein